MNTAVVCEHSQCIGGVHICDGTNRKKEEDRRYYSGKLNILLLSSWLCVLHLDGPKPPTVEAKLLPGITAMMLILK